MTNSVGGPIVEVSDLVKRFKNQTALDHATFSAMPGRVTVLLGPNGSGKTTALRILLGLTRATSGSATIGGRSYADLDAPLRTIGALLGGMAGPRRSARNHLGLLARAAGVPRERVDSLLASVGLESAAHRPASSYSLGMTRRLALAAALVADPGVLVLDEPQVGLDSDGLEWFTDTIQELARAGRTVLLSTHQLSDAEAMADDLVLLRLGAVTAAGPMSQYQGRLATVLVENGRPDEVRRSVEDAGLRVARVGPTGVHVHCTTLDPVRAALARSGVSADVRPGRTALQDLVREETAAGPERTATHAR